MPGRAAGLDQPALAHHAQHPLALYRPAEPPPHHAVTSRYPSLGLVSASATIAGLDLVGRRPARRGRRSPRLGDALDRLAADLRHARHRRGR
jgi:hypothetical protein